jgi:threonine dehydrogenase-like Zn-dependent dehydrogenase
MKAVKLLNSKVEVVDVESPEGEGVRIKVSSAGICGSDIHMLNMGFGMPVVCGHEFAGELEDGSAVAVEPLAPCGTCEQCRLGAYNMCEVGPAMILGVGRDGGMAEEVIVPRNSLIYLPSDVDPKDASLIEPLSVAMHGLRKAGLNPRMRVAVVGGGVVGLCAVACAHDVCSDVGLHARHPHQIEAGEKLGAHAPEGTYDLVVECAGTSSAMSKAVELCEPNGHLLLLGTYWDGLNFPHMEISQKGLTIHTAMLYAVNGIGRDCDLAAMLMARRPEIAESLITHRFPLEEAAKAFEVAADRKSGSIKVVLEP